MNDEYETSAQGDFTDVVTEYTKRRLYSTSDNVAITMIKLRDDFRTYCINKSGIPPSDNKIREFDQYIKSSIESEFPGSKYYIRTYLCDQCLTIHHSTRDPPYTTFKSLADAKSHAENHNITCAAPGMHCNITTKRGAFSNLKIYPEAQP